MQNRFMARAAARIGGLALVAVALCFALTVAGRSAQPVRVGGVTLFVDASVGVGPQQTDGMSWATAFNTLQGALATARTNPSVDSIWVADGVYKPDQGATPLDVNATFELVSGVSTYGGFAGGETDISQRNPTINRTILDGDLLGNDGANPSTRSDNSRHIVTVSTPTQWALLDGFVIRAGNAQGLGAGEGIGGGILIEQSALTVSRCAFEFNSALRSGGAIENMAGEATIVDCSFVGNSATGGSVRGGIIEGQGAGIHTTGGGNTQIVNSTMQRNVSGSKGGAVFAGAGQTTVTNSTLAINRAEEVGGGVFIDDNPAAMASVENSILWANSDLGGVDESAQLFISSAGVGQINFTTIQGWRGVLAGQGNDQRRPRFAGDPESGLDVCGNRAIQTPIDLRIQSGSPTIDAGNNDADIDIASPGVQPLPASDLAGLARIVDDPMSEDRGASAAGPPLVDRGAFEFLPGDCNYNGLADALEVAAGTSADCNSNGAPDECDLYAGGSRDCNTNDIPDECDIVAGTAVDANGDGALDAFRIFVDQSAIGGANDGTSWQNAYLDLSDAVAAAAATPGPCMEVWVAGGTYFPNTNGLADPKTATFDLASGVKLYGGFAGFEADLAQRDISSNATILSCDFNGDDVGSNGREENCERAVTVNGVDSLARLDGFTVTGGNAVNRGGGMQIDDSGLTVHNCIFIDNFTQEDGGGVSSVNSCVRFDTCRFEVNDARKGGGGIDALDSNLKIDRCVFVANRARVGPGGAAFSSSRAVMRSSLFLSNIGRSSFAGAAITITDPSGFGATEFINCAFVGNIGRETISVIQNRSSTLILLNSIVFLNTPNRIHTFSFGAVGTTFTRHSCGTGSDFQSGPNFDGDPLFVRPPSDGDLGDLHLRLDSPCIDIGTNGPVDPDAVDLDGNPRIVGCGVDAGAYESQRPTRLGDFDGDCAIDLNDYFIFEICHSLSGPETMPPFEECLEWFDGDGDADIDLLDFSKFANLFDPQ